MLNPKETAQIWKAIVNIYNETRDENNPTYTMKTILERWEYPKVKETFATVAKIKKHDGRIYGRNRDVMNATETNPDAVEWRYGNPMVIKQLDDIHPAHINQLISELLKVERGAA